MTARVLGVAGVLAAVAAAGVGGYLAARPASPPAPSQEVAPATAPTGQAPAAAPATPAPGAVSETEGVVEAPKPSPTPVERADAPRPAPSTSSKPATPTAKPSSRPATTSASAPSALPGAPQAAPAVTRDETPKAKPAEPAHETPAAEPSHDARAADERPGAETPPAPRAEEFVVPADSVIGLQLDDTISSETAHVEQRVQAHVSRDVHVNGTVVIPAGSKAMGQVTVVEPGGKFRERARLGVRFHTLVLADGTSVPIQTEAIYREGEAVGRKSTARIGGSALGGALIGAIFGGGKGAAIGAAAGAGAGTAATMATDKSEVTLHSGSTVTVRLTNPTTVTVEHED